jgi:(1->4)-alpha-D-glucan 1-alpha-D-glucosylmutase
MRLLGLAELTGPFQETVKSLEYLAAGMPKPSNRARYLCYQLLLALWPGENLERLQDRLTAYMLKAVREAKEFTSWLNPNQHYEKTLETFIAQLLAHPELATTIAPLAQDLARLGFKNSLTQTILKITSPGVPDFYQGSELFDLSLVDPDNRQPVDYALRQQLLTEVKGASPEDFAAWQKNSDPRAKLFIVARLLAYRSQHPGIFTGTYLPLAGTGPAAEALLGYVRQATEGTLIVALTRFPGRLEALGGPGDSFFELPEFCSGVNYREVLSQSELLLGENLYPASLPFGLGILWAESA